MKIKNIFFLFIFFQMQCTSKTSLYLDLLKRILINSIYQDIGSKECKGSGTYDQKTRERGGDWPTQAHTMVGLEALNNIQFCIEDILANNVPGDFIETGVWRGGSVIFMRGVLKQYNITNRKVFVADSFQGLPQPNPSLYPADQDAEFHTWPIFAVPLETVKDNFSRYGLLDDQVVFLKGWFRDTLPKAPLKKLALLRLDGDMYESTMDALKYLYPKLSIGGYIIIDDYSISSCRQAVDDYRKRHKILEPMLNIGTDVECRIYWKRER